MNYNFYKQNLLLFDSDIIKKYGFYTNADTDINAWLVNTPDKGKFYKKVYETVIEQSQVKKYTQTINNISKWFLEYFEKQCSKQEYSTLQEMLVYFETERDNDKTAFPDKFLKIQKITYERNIEKLTNIQKNVNINIYKYINVMYSKCINNFMNVCYDETKVYSKKIEMLEKNILSRNESIENIESKLKLYEQEYYIFKESPENYIDKFKCIKYSKQWTKLSLEEKHEKILEYCKRYHKEYEKVYQLVISNYNQKDNVITNSNIKWDRKSESIKSITNLSCNGTLLNRKQNIIENEDYINDEMLYHILLGTNTFEKVIEYLEPQFSIKQLALLEKNFKIIQKTINTTRYTHS